MKRKIGVTIRLIGGRLWRISLFAGRCMFQELSVDAKNKAKAVQRAIREVKKVSERPKLIEHFFTPEWQTRCAKERREERKKDREELRCMITPGGKAWMIARRSKKGKWFFPPTPGT